MKRPPRYFSAPTETPTRAGGTPGASRPTGAPGPARAPRYENQWGRWRARKSASKQAPRANGPDWCRPVRNPARPRRNWRTAGRPPEPRNTLGRVSARDAGGIVGSIPHVAQQLEYVRRDQQVKMRGPWESASAPAAARCAGSSTGVSAPAAARCARTARVMA